MINNMKTILSAVKQYVESGLKKSVPDWNESNPDSINYIRNRTHWEEEKKTVLVPETILEGFEFIENNIYAVINPFNMTTDLNSVYYVMWDSVEYELKWKDVDGFGCLGNINYVNTVAGGDIPFALIYDYDGGVLLVVTEGQNSHTISISETKTITHKIDEKYLPEEIGNSFSELYNRLDNTWDAVEAAQVTAETAHAMAETNATNLADEITNRESADELKMDKLNPTGIGSFSLNRKSDTIIGNCSYAEGYNTEASGAYSHAEGYNTAACGFYSHAGGYNTKAVYNQNVFGKYNIYEGLYTEEESTIKVATNSLYVFLSRNTKFYISDSYTFDTLHGMYSLTNPILITSEDLYSNLSTYKSYYIAIDSTPHNSAYTIYKFKENTIENNAIAKIPSTMFEYNEYNYYSNNSVFMTKAVYLNSSKYAHIVGNGTSDTERSNAHTLDWSGNAWFAGSVEGTALILSSPNGTRFSITVGDDGVLSATEITE